MSNSQLTSSRQSTNRDIKLLKYTPRSGGAARIVGAVWKHHSEVHWASPLLRKHNDVLDPQPFIMRFPDAAYDFDHFTDAIAWLESVCYGARELLEVTRACEAESDLGLSCLLYKGPGRSGDLISLLGGEGSTQLLDTELLRASVILTLEHLVKEHAVLKGLPLEIFLQGTSECARLHLPNDRVVHVYFDRDTQPNHVITKLLLERDRLEQLSPKSDIFFFVFAQIKTALPITLLTNVMATGMKLPHIANGLVRTVWDTTAARSRPQAL